MTQMAELSPALARRSQTAAVAAALVVGALVLGMQSEPKASDNIVIKDAKGQKRIEIGIFDDEPRIIMYDRKCRERVRLALLEEGDDGEAELRFLHPNGEELIAALSAGYGNLGDSREPSTHLYLGGPQDSGITMRAGPIPEVELQGGKPDGRASVTLNVPAGRPRISMRDKHSKERVLVRLAPDGSPALFCKDKAEAVIWQAPQEPKDSATGKPKKEK